MSSLKQLLGVRLSTCNDIVIVEAGTGSAKSYIKDRQRKFLHKLFSRTDFRDTYVGRIIDMAIDIRSPAGVIISNYVNLGEGHDFQKECMLNARSAIETSVSTRRSSYLALNPSLSKSPILNVTDISEHCRIAYTRIRTSSHRLRVETGRWARIPVESRLCGCGEIQTEEHVLLRCNLTQDIRSAYPAVDECNSLAELLEGNICTLREVSDLCAKVLRFYC